MITVFPLQDEVSIASSELDGLRNVASQIAQACEQAARAIVEQAMSLGQMVLRMKINLNWTEYRIFLSHLGWTPAKVNKYLKLAKTFGNFALSQLSKIELTTLFTLCGKTYQGVVEQLQEMQDITQESVEQLMKQARPTHKPKQQSAPVTGWKQNASGGGRHYQILLHDDETGIKIEQLAQDQKVLPQRVITDAIAAWYETHTATELPPKIDQTNFWDWEEVATVMKRDRKQSLDATSVSPKPDQTYYSYAFRQMNCASRVSQSYLAILEEDKFMPEQVNSPISNLEYDWLTVLKNKAEGLKAYQTYIQDAQQAGSQPCVELFQRLQQQDMQQAQEIRQHLQEVMQKGKM